MVPWAGLEPARLAAGDFESPASTNSATRALVLFLFGQCGRIRTDSLSRPRRVD